MKNPIVAFHSALTTVNMVLLPRVIRGEFQFATAPYVNLYKQASHRNSFKQTALTSLSNTACKDLA